MNKSLRDEVERLASDWNESASACEVLSCAGADDAVMLRRCARQIAATLAAHPIDPDWQIGYAQAIEFVQYVEDHARGTMVDAAKRFLSLPYSQALAKRIVAADGVVVPRELFKDLRMIAMGAQHEYTTGPFVNNRTAKWYADTMTQATAILSTGDGV